MSDYTELKRLAQAAIVALDKYNADECNYEFAEAFGAADDAFHDAAGPATVLALIAENERLERLALDSVNAEYAGSMDLESICAERDQLRAEVAGLRTGYEAYEQVNAELKAENEALLSAMNEILRVTPMGVEAFDIAALVLGELSGAALGQGEQS